MSLAQNKVYSMIGLAMKAGKLTSGEFAVEHAVKAGKAALASQEYYDENCKKIIESREWTESELEKLGFETTESHANFVFAKSDRISGKELYLKLKQKGVLVRHFDKQRICQYNRITVGTAEQMKILLEKIKEIFEEENL